MITVKLLRRMGVSQAVADVWADPLDMAALRYGMNVPTVAEDWLGQLVHESEGLTKDRENLYYTTPERLVAVWDTRFSMSRGSKLRYAPDYVRNPAKLANAVYAGRMGNGPESSGDGYRFSGGGPGMLTGREMWEAYAEFSGNDVVNHPELFKDPLIGADSAAWMFAVAKGLIDEARADLVKTITKRINGGYIGLEKRKKLTAIARQYFVEQGFTLDQPVVPAVAQAATVEPIPEEHSELQWGKDDQGQDIVTIQPEQKTVPDAATDVVPSGVYKGIVVSMLGKFVVPMIGGWIRHAMTTVGGIAVMKGYIEADTADQVVGVAMTLIGVAWSSFAKSQKVY